MEFETKLKLAMKDFDVFKAEELHRQDQYWSKILYLAKHMKKLELMRLALEKELKSAYDQMKFKKCDL